MTTEIIYSKKFSGIPYLQEEEKITYNILSTVVDSKSIFGIKVSSNINNEVLIKDIAFTKEAAINILTYLYENSIKPEFVGDVVNDIFNKKIEVFNEHHLFALK